MEANPKLAGRRFIGTLDLPGRNRHLLIVRQRKQWDPFQHFRVASHRSLVR
jgi:hypothetical protein